MRLYTYVPDIPDFRDYSYAEYGPKVASPPAAMDFRGLPFLSKVKDQLQLGRCTGMSGTSDLEFIRRKQGLPGDELSNLMWYYGERAYEHTTRSDSGAQIRDGIKFAANYGVCSDALWPSADISRFKRKPTKACYAAAKLNRISKYVRLGMDSDLKTDIINCLASGLPFTFGFSVYESFESDAVARTGMVPMPGRTEKLLGGHAVYAIGYMMINGVLYILVRNSWGTAWGISGDFLIRLDYLTNSNLAEDFWAILP